MKRILYAVTLLSMGSIMGCERIDNEITDIENRVDIIEDALIKSIDEQIEGINNSIGDLRSVDTELDGYIKNLEETTSDLQTRINTADGEIKRVEEELGEDIKEVSVAFDEFKGDVEQFIDDTNDQIGNLRNADETLSGKIDALETYLITEISNTKTWAEETFATLKQYDEIQRVISRIKEDIGDINTAIGELEKNLNKKIEDDIKRAIDALRTELSADYGAKIEAEVVAVTNAYTQAIDTAKSDITTAYTKAIDDAIKSSESSMKSWVNETLADGYYDIAAIDAKLSALEDALTTAYTDADAALAKQIEAQRAALNQAKADLTAAYQEAIKEAIDTNNGVINSAIASAVATAQSALQTQIDDINSMIANIENRLSELETNFVNRIQSFIYIPEYSDGKATMNYTSKSATLDFIISPATVVPMVKSAFDVDNNVIKAFVRYTKTRAVGDAIQLKVESMAVGNDGLFTLTILENGLSEEFWKGSTEAIIYVHIADGNNDIISNPIPLIASGYVGDGE